MIDLQKNMPAPAWPPSGGAGSCRTCEPAGLDEIRQAIQNKYAEVSVSAGGKFQYPVGKEGARALGYDAAIIESAPEQFFESFCGVGNPFSLGPIEQGSTLLDFGCGAGFDLFVAGRFVGGKGRLYGIDLTEEMVQRAKKNLAEAGAINVEIRKVGSEAIPYGDHFFDTIISNGAVNLSPDKEATFKEIHRVLKPGGRLQFADVMLEKELPANLAGSAEAWSQWIGGAIPVGDQIKLLRSAGFSDVEYRGATGFRTSEYTLGGLFRANKKS